MQQLNSFVESFCGLLLLNKLRELFLVADQNRKWKIIKQKNSFRFCVHLELVISMALVYSFILIFTLANL